MRGAPIEQLNQGYEALRESIAEDPLARKRTEIAVVTFGGQVKLAVPFTEGRELAPTTFTAGGNTPLGAALDFGLNQLLARKQQYKEAGLDYFRPWLFVITDGAPTDGAYYTKAAERVREEEGKRAVTVFGVGVEGADMEVLAMLSTQRQPLALDGLKFTEMFQWLSQSMSIVTQSTPGGSDEEIYDAEMVEQTALPVPNGWATW
jgi:uncharacterized protein YegL